MTSCDTLRHDLGHEVLLRLNQSKRIDMKISVDITGIANCPVRDSAGNLLPFVWTRQSVCNEFDNATLLTREALQRHLQNFIDAGVRENQDLLQKVNDPALLVDWVVRTAEYWEKRYAEKRNEKYDISQTVFSAMYEIVFNTVWPLLTSEYGFEKVSKKLEQQMQTLQVQSANTTSNKYHMHILEHISAGASAQEKDLESFFWMHRGHNGLVRLLFRADIPNLREHLCMLAGKLLQKKEVCNRAGTYASHRQRSDVLQEWCNCKRDFQLWFDENAHAVLRGLLQALDKEDWIFLLIDHTAVPLSLASIKPVDADPEMQGSMQGTCSNQASKRQKVHEI